MCAGMRLWRRITMKVIGYYVTFKMAGTLQDRQIKNIVRKLEHQEFVYLHDKRLINKLTAAGFKIIREIREDYIGAGKWDGRGAVKPAILMHWIRIGRIWEDELCHYIPRAKPLFNASTATYELAREVCNDILEYGGYRGLLATQAILHKSELYVTRGVSNRWNFTLCNQPLLSEEVSDCVDDRV